MSRSEFSSKICDAAWERAGGICECHRLAEYGIEGFTAEGCGQRLGPVGNIYYEHIIVDRAGGKPTLDNCAVLTRACWRKKTDTHDQPVAAETKRQERMDRGIRPRQRKGQPMPGSRASGWRKPMFGPAERRT
ncbi:MAG: hypothetical protein KF723_22365 [Rhizobiaceae bacterium]|nr:hypothetical protein [Rhizobiaceae bacterium]